MNEAIYLSELTVAYTDKHNKKKQNIVLNNVNLKIPTNQILGIIGESGSGKTTLAKVISGLCPANAKIISGKVYFENSESTHNFVKTKTLGGIRICMLMQDPFLILNPSLKIRNQLRYCLKMNKKEFISHANSILEEVGILHPEEVLNKYPSELSGGINQRICIAIGLAQNPDILIFDEPTSAIDANNIEIILNLITKLTALHKISTIIISHDITSVKKVVNEIIVMQHGQIVEQVEKVNEAWDFRNIYSQELLSTYSFKHSQIVTDASDELISFIDISKSFKKRVLFKNLSFKIYRGDVLGLVGASGSGKSTIAKLICGIYKLDTGQIIKKKNLNIEMVFQNAYASLNPQHKVKKLLNENSTILHKCALTVDELYDYIKYFPLPEDILDRRVDELSGGQRQMIAIIRALIASPDVIVFDEPTSALDALTQKKLIDLILRIKEIFSLTYIIISHDLRLVENISTQIIKL